MTEHVKTRIEHEYNNHLSIIIPIIYGAVFSYAMYALSLIILEYWNFFTANLFSLETFSNHEPYMIKIALFFLVMLFMVQDIGCVIKYSFIFPYKRTSRYTHEVFIAFLYVGCYAFISAGSYLALVTLSILLFWGGVWSNQLKEEYKYEYIKTMKYISTKRDLHYFAGPLLGICTSLFIILTGARELQFQNTHVIIVIFIIWLSVFAFFPNYRHGKEFLKYSVNIIVPDRFLMHKED